MPQKRHKLNQLPRENVKKRVFCRRMNLINLLKLNFKVNNSEAVCL